MRGNRVHEIGDINPKTMDRRNDTGDSLQERDNIREMIGDRRLGREISDLRRKATDRGQMTREIRSEAADRTPQKEGNRQRTDDKRNQIGGSRQNTSDRIEQTEDR